MEAGHTPKDGKLIGFPIDIGPTGLLPGGRLREGRAADRPAGADGMSTWDAFFDAGEELKAVPAAYMVETPSSSRSRSARATKRFVDEDQVHRRPGPRPRGLGPRGQGAARPVSKVVSGGQDFNAALEQGTLPGHRRRVGGPRHQVGAEEQGQVAGGRHAGRPRQRRRFVPGDPEGCRNPKQAFEIITWLLSPDNQAQGFTDAALFPSTPATYGLKPAARTRTRSSAGRSRSRSSAPPPRRSRSPTRARTTRPLKTPFFAELTNVEAKGKNPDQAWKDAVTEGRRSRNGWG